MKTGMPKNIEKGTILWGTTNEKKKSLGSKENAMNQETTEYST